MRVYKAALRAHKSLRSFIFEASFNMTDKQQIMTEERQEREMYQVGNANKHFITRIHISDAPCRIRRCGTLDGGGGVHCCSTANGVQLHPRPPKPTRRRLGLLPQPR